jgi:hypothetical protein
MKPGSTLASGEGGALFSSSLWQAVSAIAAIITTATVRIGEATREALREAGQTLIVEVIFAVSVIF